MSYRTHVNNTQLFGNNEYLEPWAEHLKNNGIEIDEDGCYDGYLDDFESALKAIEKCVAVKQQESDAYKARMLPIIRKELETRPDDMSIKLEARALEAGFADMTYLFDTDRRLDTSLFDVCWEAVHSMYALLPYQFYLACKDLLEQADPTKDETGTFRIRRFRLKQGERIHVRAG